MKTITPTWNTLFGEKAGDVYFTRERCELIENLWKKGGSKAKEGLACKVMDMYADAGVAKGLEVFTDVDGQKYHQYLFPKFKGVVMHFTRRVPFGIEDQDGSAYDELVGRYEDVEHFVMILSTAGMLGTEDEEYLKNGETYECNIPVRI